MFTSVYNVDFIISLLFFCPGPAVALLRIKLSTKSKICVRFLEFDEN